MKLAISTTSSSPSTALASASVKRVQASTCRAGGAAAPLAVLESDGPQPASMATEAARARETKTCGYDVVTWHSLPVVGGGFYLSGQGNGGRGDGRYCRPGFPV